MSIFNLYEEIKKGPEGHYFLYAEEPFMLLEAYEALLTYIKERGEELSLKVIDISERPAITDIIEVLKTPVFFGHKGWIVIKEAHLLKPKDLLLIASSHLLWESHVFFLYNKNPDKEVFDIFKGIASKSDEPVKIKFISIELKEEDIPRWIHLKAKNLGIELTKEALQYLFELIDEPGLIATELKKIAIAGIRKPSKDELKELVFTNLDYDPIDLINAIKKGDRVKALYIFKSLKDNLPLAIGLLNKIYSNSPDYKKALPILHEMDFRSKVYKDFLEPLFLKLLELKVR